MNDSLRRCLTHLCSTKVGLARPQEAETNRTSRVRVCSGFDTLEVEQVSVATDVRRTMAEKAEVMEAKLPAGQVLSMEPQDYDAMEQDFREARNLGRETPPLEQHSRRLGLVRRTLFV